MISPSEAAPGASPGGLLNASEPALAPRAMANTVVIFMLMGIVVVRSRLCLEAVVTDNCTDISVDKIPRERPSVCLLLQMVKLCA